MDITSEIIRERLPLTGISQSEIAKMINVSPAQLTQYLNGNSSLNKDSLDKLIKLVGINLVVYKNRLSLAKEVATKLAGVTAEELVNMSKLDMIRLTGFKQIRFYPEFSKDELNEILETMAFDYEDTFSYFKSQVLFYKEAGEKENYTHTVTKNTWMKLADIASRGVLVGGIIGSITK
jgi:transcriptional regulator with XRE-family HTH domain